MNVARRLDRLEKGLGNGGPVCGGRYIPRITYALIDPDGTRHGEPPAPAHCPQCGRAADGIRVVEVHVPAAGVGEQR